MSDTPSPNPQRDPWAIPGSEESQTLCIPSDIPYPSNIQSILSEARKSSSDPKTISWKEIVCAGPDDMPSEEKSNDNNKSNASIFEQPPLESKRSNAQPKRSNESPHKLSPEDAKRLFDVLEST
ncbi:MAG: hypothetical protein Q9178_000390 [Gyalolechia marmorata]